MIPISAIWARIELPNWVCCSTTSWRARWVISAACSGTLFNGTNCMLGRLTASQQAAASALSFFLPQLT